MAEKIQNATFEELQQIYSKNGLLFWKLAGGED